MLSNIVKYFKTSHNITLTPAGIWKMKDGKKTAIDAERVDNLSWSSYPKDNMARTFLNGNNIIILDVDGEPTTIKDNTISIPSLNLTLPLGLYTQTTNKGKYHIYYSTNNKDLPNRLVKLHSTQIDIFTYGVVFEGHSFSPYNELHKGEILPLPQSLADSIEEHLKEKPQLKQSGKLSVVSNPQRANLVQSFLDDTLKTEKARNKFFSYIMPQEYKAKRKRHLDITDYSLSYDLFNKLATKLTATAELGFNEHVVPTLRKLLVMWGKEPDSKISQRLMFKNILPSLPQHEPILQYNRDDDPIIFQDHLNSQVETTTPIFRTIFKSKIYYIEVDKLTQKIIAHGDSYYLDHNTARALHPERNIVSEEGKVIGWDDNVPILYTVNNPYKPLYEFDEENYRHIINLYAPTQYITDAEHFSQTSKPDNIIMRAVESIIDPKYLELYLAYSAQIIFGDESPTMVVWVAALDTELGGSGKSVVTLELFSHILGSAASASEPKTVMSGWGDIVTSTRVLSLEDMPQLSQKEWDLVYANIKQQNTNSYRKLNMKGGVLSSQRVNISITGSSNFRPSLSPSDRRFLCLEPAQLHEITKPLSPKDRRDLAELLRSHNYSEEIQEYTNYLKYLYEKGFSDKIRDNLFIEAPNTKYRKLWINKGSNNTSNVVHTLQTPWELMALCRFDSNSIRELIDLFKLPMKSYCKETSKTAVSWKWFEAILPFVQSEKYAGMSYSKSAIAKMLHIDFKNTGIYAKTWRDDTGTEWSKWPHDGYVFFMDEDILNEYKAIVNELIKEI